MSLENSVSSKSTGKKYLNGKVCWALCAVAKETSVIEKVVFL